MVAPMKGRWIGLFSVVAACSSRGGSLDFNVEGGASDVSAAVDQGTTPVDNGAPVEDAGAPPADNGAPPVDLGPGTTCDSDRECSEMGLVCDRVMHRCVECIADADCGRGRYCPPSHVCAAQVCTPGESTCLGATRQSTCNSRGSAQTESACASGETCRGNRCQPSACTPGASTCDEATGQRRVCNTEGSGTTLVACASGQRCSDGVCVAQACTPNSRTCASITSIRVCDSTGSSSTTMACPAFPNAMGACGANTCGFTCMDGFGNCDGSFSNGCETPFGTSTAHCGACGRACSSGQTCRDGACSTVSTSGNFRVTSLGMAACTVVTHEGLSGDDRGGIATSTDAVFYSGDSATIRLPFGSSSPTSLGTIHDALFSDLATGDLYVLLTSTGAELTQTGTAAGSTVTQLGRLSTAGALTSTRVSLSAPIAMTGAQSDAMIFAGYGQVVLYSGTADGSTPGTWYAVSLPSGAVRSLGTFAMPSHTQCENWAAWGIAESVGGELSVLYVESGSSIARLNLTTRTTTSLTFSNLGDACSITFSTSRNRWHLHSEQTTQFSSTLGEVLVSCDATWTTSP